jgi:outer membrane biosynthesis protein TonB
VCVLRERDPDFSFSGRSKGYGFVDMESHDEQVKALDNIKDVELEGRTIYLKVALSERPRENEEKAVESADAKKQDVKKETAEPIKKEEAAPAKKEEPVPVKKEEPVKKEAAVPAKKEEPVPAKKEEPAPVKKEEPAPVKKEEPVAKKQ